MTSKTRCLVGTERLGLFGKTQFFFPAVLKTPPDPNQSSSPQPAAPPALTEAGQVEVRLSLAVQQLLPTNGLGKHLPLQPELVGVVEVLGELQALAQYALQAVVHRGELRVLGLVVPAAVEGLDVGPQGAFLSLEIPRPCIDVCSEGQATPKYCGKHHSDKV